jgi:HAD superfamily hydrolase (TIGR01509 family)
MMVPEALLVDMDGTLVDSEERWLAAEVRLMEDLGSSWNSFDQEHCLGGPLERVIAYMIGKSGGEHDHDELQARLLKYALEAFGAEPLQFNMNIVRLVVLAREQDIPSALVTASDRSLVDVVLTQIEKDLGFQPFTVVIAAGDTMLGKPHPDPYLAAARFLGVTPGRSLAFEDSPTGARAAVAAGCGVIALPILSPIDVPGAVNIQDLSEKSLMDLWLVARDNSPQD